MNWAVPEAGTGTRPHSLGGELGVYAPRCRSRTWGTPSRWEWRSRDTAAGMSSLRPAMSRVTGPADADRSTVGSGGGRLGGSRAGERRGCGPWPLGGRGGPPSTGRAGGGLLHGGRGGWRALVAHRGTRCDASAAGCRGDGLGCGGGTGTGPSGGGCTCADIWSLVLRPIPTLP